MLRAMQGNFSNGAWRSEARGCGLGQTASYIIDALTTAQCEDVTAALEAAKRPGARVAEPATPTSKLHAAALHDNDRFLAAEGDQQQLLLRCALLAAVCCRTGVVGVEYCSCMYRPTPSAELGARIVSGRLQVANVLRNRAACSRPMALSKGLI